MSCHSSSFAEIANRRFGFATAVWFLATTIAINSPGTANDWTATAYRAKVIVLLDEAPELREAWEHALPSALTRLLHAHFGPVCQVESTVLPAASWRCEDIAGITHEQMRQWEPASSSYDKLYVLIIECLGDHVRLGCVEWDMRTRIFSDRKIIPQVSMSSLDRAAAAAILRAFRPIGRVSHVQNTSVKLEMRSSLLGRGNTDDTFIVPGDILQPVNCRLNRLGEITDDGVEVVPWTMLRVDKPDAESGQSVEYVSCSIDSGLRSPFRVRSSRRVERYAIRVTPQFDHTIVRFMSASDPGKPLVGYELYSRHPDQEGFRLVGSSNRLGEVDVARESSPYQMLYAKHGNVLLVRLPCLVGLQQEITLKLPDYQERLKAEAFVRGIEDDVLDAIVRREIATSKFRRHIGMPPVSDRDLQGAKEVLREIEAVNKPDPLFREIQRREATFHSDDRAVQLRIDSLFSELRQTIRTSMNPQYVAKLEAELNAAIEKSSDTSDETSSTRAAD